MRETADYRNVLEDLHVFTGGKRLMSSSDVSAYLGCCRQTAAKRYGIGRDGILTVRLARLLSETPKKGGKR